MSYETKKESIVKRSPNQQRTPLKDTEFFKKWKKTAKSGATFPRDEFMHHQEKGGK